MLQAFDCVSMQGMQTIIGKAIRAFSELGARAARRQALVGAALAGSVKNASLLSAEGKEGGSRPRRVKVMQQRCQALFVSKDNICKRC